MVKLIDLLEEEGAGLSFLRIMYFVCAIFCLLQFLKLDSPGFFPFTISLSPQAILAFCSHGYSHLSLKLNISSGQPVSASDTRYTTAQDFTTNGHTLCACAILICYVTISCFFVYANHFQAKKQF